MGKMKEIAISIEEIVEQEVYNEWCMVDNYIEESKQYITVHVKDLVNFELQKLGLSMSQQEIQGMVENAINNTYGV
jgi:phage regulator Rha-like protein